MIMTRTLALSFIGIVLFASASCGDSSGAGGGGATSSASSTSSKSSASSTSSGAMSCIQPGDPGNAQGVGHYCTQGGGECAQFPKANICLADLGQSETFCTKIGCQTQDDCGDNAGCHIDPMGSACVLCKCDDTAVGCSSTSTTSSSSSSSASGTSSSSGG
jgi:hypothetical protein